MGLFFNKTTFLTNFVNLKIQNIINLVEGKDRNYSTSIITEKNNLLAKDDAYLQFVLNSTKKYNIISPRSQALDTE
jgi:hypothetical protein